MYQFKPTLEGFEPRTMPAGLVTAFVHQGYLQLIGDSEANEIRILQPASQTVAILPLGSTLINGAATPTILGGIDKGIDIRLGDGNDTLVMDGSNLGPRFFIDTGAGDDKIAAANVKAGSSAVVETGAGNDQVSFVSSRFRRNARISLGDGQDLLNLSHSKLRGKAEITGGLGGDALAAPETQLNRRKNVSSFESGRSNIAPIAFADQATVTVGSSTTIPVFANDLDPEGQLQRSSIVITQQPTTGTATANPDGTVTFEHNGSSIVPISFRYTIRDAIGAVSNEATITVSTVITVSS